MRLVYGEDGQCTEAMDEASVYGYLARIADWVKVTACGWRRAHEHTDAPGEDAIVDPIVQRVLNEVCAYFDVDDEDRPA